jgi:hypothetical protein
MAPNLLYYPLAGSPCACGAVARRGYAYFASQVGWYARVPRSICTISQRARHSLLDPLLANSPPYTSGCSSGSMSLSG